jgi:hypothetical protein
VKLIREAGTPQTFDPPSDDKRLLMLALGESKHKRTSIWHVHVLETSEAAVDAQTFWYVTFIRSQFFTVHPPTKSL